MAVSAEDLRLESCAGVLQSYVLTNALARSNAYLAIGLRDVRFSLVGFSRCAQSNSRSHICSAVMHTVRLCHKTILARRQAFYSKRAVRHTRIARDDFARLNLFGPNVRAHGGCARCLINLARNRSESFRRAVERASACAVVVRERARCCSGLFIKPVDSLSRLHDGSRFMRMLKA